MQRMTQCRLLPGKEATPSTAETDSCFFPPFNLPHADDADDDLERSDAAAATVVDRRM